MIPRDCVLLVPALLLFVTSMHAQAPTINAVVNAAWSSAALSPGVLTTLFGANLGPAAPTTGAPVPASVISVAVGGKAGFVMLATSNQVNFQVPTDAPIGATTVVVTTPAGSSTPFNVTIASLSPGLPSIGGGGTNPVGTFLRLNGSRIDAPSPVTPGDGMVVFAYGLGPTTPAAPTGPAPNAVFATNSKPTVTIGSTDAPVIASNLAPTLVGTYAVQIQVPASIPEGSQLLTLRIAGFTSNIVTLPVGKPVPLKVAMPDGASDTATIAVKRP